MTRRSEEAKIGTGGMRVQESALLGAVVLEGLGVFVVEPGAGGGESEAFRPCGGDRAGCEGTGVTRAGHCGHANGRPQSRSAGSGVSGPGTGAGVVGGEEALRGPVKAAL